jgi:hypothetical protein
MMGNTPRASRGTSLIPVDGDAMRASFGNRIAAEQFFGRHIVGPAISTFPHCRKLIGIVEQEGCDRFKLCRRVEPK